MWKSGEHNMHTSVTLYGIFHSLHLTYKSGAFPGVSAKWRQKRGVNEALAELLEQRACGGTARGLPARTQLA